MPIQVAMAGKDQGKDIRDLERHIRKWQKKGIECNKGFLVGDVFGKPTVDRKKRLEESGLEIILRTLEDIGYPEEDRETLGRRLHSRTIEACNNGEKIYCGELLSKMSDKNYYKALGYPNWDEYIRELAQETKVRWRTLYDYMRIYREFVKSGILSLDEAGKCMANLIRLLQAGFFKDITKDDRERWLKDARVLPVRVFEKRCNTERIKRGIEGRTTKMKTPRTDWFENEDCVACGKKELVIAICWPPGSGSGKIIPLCNKCAKEAEQNYSNIANWLGKHPSLSEKLAELYERIYQLEGKDES